MTRTGFGGHEARKARPPRQLPCNDPHRLLQGHHLQHHLVTVRFSVTIKRQQKIDSSFSGAVLISVLSGERLRNLEASLPPCQVRASRILVRFPNPLVSQVKVSRILATVGAFLSSIDSSFNFYLSPMWF